MSKLKIKILKYLLNNIFKYNKNDCREKFVESVQDDIYFLLNK